jgi:hypothetical protein
MGVMLENHRAAELVTSDLLCCPAPSGPVLQIGSLVVSHNKQGRVTAITPQGALVQWQYPDFGAKWFDPLELVP